jgi:[histone H3]-lysine36 N-dimethyltransferase SETMAR
MITCDEKWVYYKNFKRYKHWVNKGEIPPSQPKQEMHQKKVMMSVWWDKEGVIYYELLPRNTTVTAAYYCAQLNGLDAVLREKRPDLFDGQVIYFHQDNARPHVAEITKLKIQELGWQVVPHPPYSPDLAPSDYYLFRSLGNELKGVESNGDNEIEAFLTFFFEYNSEEFIDTVYTVWDKTIRT